MVVVSYMLLLHLTPTCADTGPDLLQLVLMVFYLPSTGANTLLAHVVQGHCTLQLVYTGGVFLPTAGADTPLALCGVGGMQWLNVGVACGGG